MANLGSKSRPTGDEACSAGDTGLRVGFTEWHWLVSGTAGVSLPFLKHQRSKNEAGATLADARTVANDYSMHDSNFRPLILCGALGGAL